MKKVFSKRGDHWSDARNIRGMDAESRSFFSIVVQQNDRGNLGIQIVAIPRCSCQYSLGEKKNDVFPLFCGLLTGKSKNAPNLTYDERKRDYDER